MLRVGDLVRVRLPRHQRLADRERSGEPGWREVVLRWVSADGIVLEGSALPRGRARLPTLWRGSPADLLRRAGDPI